MDEVEFFPDGLDEPFAFAKRAAGVAPNQWLAFSVAVPSADTLVALLPVATVRAAWQRQARGR